MGVDRPTSDRECDRPTAGPGRESTSTPAARCTRRRRNTRSRCRGSLPLPPSLLLSPPLSPPLLSPSISPSPPLPLSLESKTTTVAIGVPRRDAYSADLTDRRAACMHAFVHEGFGTALKSTRKVAHIVIYKEGRSPRMLPFILCGGLHPRTQGGTDNATLLGSGKSVTLTNCHRNLLFFNKLRRKYSYDYHQR